MIRKALLFIVLSLVSLNQVKAVYVDKPVLSHVRISGQHDTFGFNLAMHLPDFIYEQVKAGQLTLWASPKKITRLNFSALQEIERSSNTKFKNCSDVFLHEFWDCSKRKLSFVIAGFSFMYNSGEVRKPYGFIDAQEAFRLLASNLIPCNPNAPADLTYWEAINSKRFNFTIVQYGRKQFASKPMESVELKNKIFDGKRKMDPKIPWPNSKLIIYELEDDYLIDHDYSQYLKKGLEKYFNKNRSLIQSHDPGNFYDSGDYKGYFQVTGLQIHETWSKRGPLFLSYVDSMVVYINNKKMMAFTVEEIRNFNMKIRFKSVIDILKEKSFKLNIISINNVLIDPKNQALYKKGLEEYKWTQITEYVKYESTKD